jgi:glycosyltransferase involved in cell wall biosynthesis
MTAPEVTVIMATYGRGRFILPSIRSVLAQSLTGFQLRVVGDATSDETGEVVRAMGDPRVSFANLTARVGSQTGPNNAGIAASRGQIIAYLGHDDIWEQDHLARLSALFEGDPALDFAVSGAIFHLPNGMKGAQVTGLFEGDGAQHDHFFPPSSFAHRRSVMDRIGLWRMPLEIPAPVDADFLLRAAAAGMRFASTGVVTVHKFAAGHRYLSYLEPDADEQEAMVAALATPGHAARIAALVAAARAGGTFMATRHRDYSLLSPGQLARQNAQLKGVTQIALKPLGRRQVIQPRAEPRTHDWHGSLHRGLRWTAGNPVPRLALPVTGEGLADLRLTVAHKRRTAIDRIALRCNGALLQVRMGLLWFDGRYWRRHVHTVVPLAADRPTVLHLLLEPSQQPQARVRGLGLGRMVLRPAGVPWWRRFRQA